MVVGLARCNKSLSIMYMSLTASYSFSLANRSLWFVKVND
jgi:hypothetical protein